MWLLTFSHERLRLTLSRTQVSYNEHVHDMGEKFDATKAKLKEFGEASDGAWENLKDGVENAWHSLSDSVKDATAKFKA